MKQKTKDYFISLIDSDGLWHGSVRDDTPVFTIDDTAHDARVVAKSLGLKLNGIWQFKPAQSNKYKKVEKDADLEQTLHSGHPEESGDGVGESQE